MDGSSSSQSDDRFTQSLPTVEALDLNNCSCSEGMDDKQQPVASPAVPTNELQLTINHCEENKSNIGNATDGARKCTNRMTRRLGSSSKPVKESGNGKDSEVVMLPSNQDKPAPGEMQTLLKQVSLPYVESSGDGNQSHHQDGVADVKQHGKHHPSSKRPGRKVSQQQEEKTNHPVRVTRSTSKLMAQLMAGSSEVSDKKSHHNGHHNGRAMENSADEISQSQHSTDDDCGQIKYNKSRGFPATAKVTNWTRSEMNRIFTNNGTKHNGHQSSTVNRNDVNKRSHITDGHILTDPLQPLLDVTNSSTSSDTTANIKPLAQARVYDLVAGKKSKKGKRQQPRKAVLVPHKKKLTTSEEIENASSKPTEEHLEPVSAKSDKSLTHVKDTLTLYHGQASEQSRHSGELVSE